MSVGSLLRSSYLLYFSQPAADRALFKAIKGQPIRSIVELGIGFSGRTERILEIAGWRTDCQPLRYTGIDQFEARPATHAGMSLKQAFAHFRSPGVKVQLVPGDANSALRRVANSLSGTDLLLVSSDLDQPSLEQAWNWVPRMLTPTSVVFVEESPASGVKANWRQLRLEDVQKLANAAGRSLRRAA